MLITALFKTAHQNGNNPKCPSVVEWMDKILAIYMVEYYSTIKRNKVLIHATTWINLENILNGRSQSQKTVHHMIPFT